MQKEFESRKQEYLYQLLDRLRTDCEYYLGNGNHHPDTLWAGNEQGQIAKMKEIWLQLEEKPEWLSWEDIINYADKMGVEELPSTKDGTAEKEINDMLDRNHEKEKKVGLEESDNGLELLQDIEKEQTTEKPLEYVNVYQIIEKTEYRFMSYDFAKGKINLDDYKLVAKVPVYKEFKNRDALLEYVFAYGNSNEEYYKNNPEARSISMSDILQIGDNENYYVDTFGFVYIGKGDKLTEAEIHTNQNNIDLEKEKEEVEQQLQDVEELQAKKKELDDKVDELFEAKITDYIDEKELDDIIKTNSILNVANSYKILDNMILQIKTDTGYSYYKIIKNDDSLEAYWISSSGKKLGDTFILKEAKTVKEESQVSNYTLEQVGSCLKDKGNDFKMQIQGSDTKTNWLNLDKEDLQKIYNTLSYKKKKTESAYDDLDIEPGSEEEAIYNNLVDRNLKAEFDSLSKEEQEAYLELIPENGNQISSELIEELAELSDLDYDLLYWVINIRGNNINESKIERFVEFDVIIWHNDVNQRRILNTLSDIIYDNAGELLDTSNMEIINFDKTKYTLQVKIDKNITEKQLDEKISDGIYDIGAEVDDISEYREIQPKTIIEESKGNSFPSSDFSSEKLSYSDLDELISTFSEFKKFITPEQEKWLIENGFSVNELYEGLKEILSTFKSSAFKEIISIDEYIEELNNSDLLNESVSNEEEIFNGDTEVNLKLIDGTIIHIACDSNGEGYYYEVYDSHGDEIDGGLMEYEDGEVDRDVPVKEVIERIAEFAAIPSMLDKDTVRIGDDEFVKLTDKVYDSDDYYYVLPTGKYLTFHRSLSEDGIDYTLYNEDGNEDDGGILEIDTNNNSKEAILSELLKFIGMNDINSSDVDEIDEETFDNLIED